MNKLKKINLQLFAEGTPAAPNPAPAPEPAPAAAPIEPAPAPVEPTPTEPVSTSQRLKSLWEKANVQQPTPDKVDTPAPQAPAQEPPAKDNPAEPQAQPDKKFLGKYDEEGIVKAYQNIQSAYTKDHQALLDTQKVLEQLKAEKAELEAKMQMPNSSTQQPPADDLANLDAEELLERFYEDPKGVLAKIAESVVEGKVKPLESKIAPVIEHTEAQRNLNTWNEAAEEFQKNNSDMVDYLDGMKEYIGANNLQTSKEPQKVLEDAYAHAKSKAADAKIAEANAKIAELEAKLQTSKEDAVKEHLTNVRSTQNQIPNTIAGNSNSGAPATPPLSLKGKPMSEVHKAASAYIFGDK